MFRKLKKFFRRVFLRKRRYKLCKLDTWGWTISSKNWDTWWVCCNCYRHVRPAGILSKWFQKDKPCPVCGAVGDVEWIILKKPHYKWYEIKKGDKKKKAITCEQFKKACQYVLEEE